MPQKKNPDMAELIRAKTGRVYGDLIALLTVMKGLPLAYNRDMQEDKEPLFDAADTVGSCLRMLTLMIPGITFNTTRFQNEITAGFLFATSLADYLVRKGKPFREAHAIVGAIVRKCESRKIGLKDLALRDYRRFSNLFENDLYHALTGPSTTAGTRNKSA